jgi:hypothetical protein
MEPCYQDRAQISKDPSYPETTDPERTRLLRLLESRYGNSFQQNLQRCAIIQEYNRLIERRAEERKRFDPLVHFPTEMWTKIVEYVIEENSEASMTLCLVSEQWCRGITSIPSLWTRICLRHDADLEIAEACLFLSSHYPLSIIVQLPIVDPKMKEFLLRARDNIKHLEVIGPEYTYVEEILTTNHLGSFLQEVEGLPNLKTISADATSICSYTPTSIGKIFELAPKLQELRHIKQPIVVDLSRCIDALSLSRICSLRLVFNRHYDILGVLQQAQALKYLILGEEENNDDIMQMDSIDASTIPPVRLRRLDMSLTGKRATLIPSLLAATSFTLVTLTIHLEDNSMIHLVKYKISLPNLLALEVSCSTSNSKIESNQICFPSFPSLQELKCDFSSEEVSLKYGVVRPLVFFSWVKPTIKDIKWMSISSSYKTRLLISDILEFIGCCPDIISLRIECPTDMEPYPSRKNFHRLEHLTLSDSSFLRFINCPNLLQLSVCYRDPEGLWPTDMRTLMSMETYPFEFYSFPGLRSIWTNGLSWAHTSYFCSFKNLTEIAVNHNQVMNMPWDSSINRLLTAILFFPDCCPNLEYISTTSFPNWELLFMTLEVRNIWSYSRASPIRYIRLRAYPADWLLTPLKSLLRLQIPDLLPEEDLIALTLGSKYFDRNIRSCHCCYYTGYSCYLPVEEVPQSRFSQKSSKDKLSQGSFPYDFMSQIQIDSIPQRIARWYSQWRERESIWERDWETTRQFYYRVWACHRHQDYNYYKAATIDGNS